MVLPIVPVDRSLWRIAQLSSQCSDPSWPGDKDRAWSLLKETIADLRARVMETTAAIEAAELRAARAEGRIRVARRERDRERTAHQALRATAEAARQERPGEVPRGVMGKSDSDSDSDSDKVETAAGSVERYLHVGATMGNLLPEDLGEFLIEGATLVRREGRLAALISVPSEESEWAAPGPRAEEQVQRLAAEGFRVQWVREICLAS
jgi:hypothetical protein